MPSYYEALPINKAAMKLAVLVDTVVQRFAKGRLLVHKAGRLTPRFALVCPASGNVKWRHLAYIFERTMATKEEEETPR